MTKLKGIGIGKIRIIDDGIRQVKIINVSSGEEIKGVYKYTITHDAHNMAIAVLEFRNVECDINAECVDK